MLEYDLHKLQKKRNLLLEMKIIQKIIALSLVIASSLILLAPISVGAITCDEINEKTSIIDLDCGSKSGEDAIWSLLEMAIGILTAGVGVLALAGIVYGAVLYSSSGGNPEQTKKAMGIIKEVIIGIVAYAIMYTLLNWLIPGGVFS